VRSGREQSLAPEHRDKPGAYCISTGQLREKQGSDVKRIGVEGSEASGTQMSEHDRPISGQPDLLAPALGVVGGTPGWAVREIISIYFRACGAIVLE